MMTSTHIFCVNQVIPVGLKRSQRCFLWAEFTFNWGNQSDIGDNLRLGAFKRFLCCIYIFYVLTINVCFQHIEACRSVVGTLLNDRTNHKTNSY